MDTFLSIFSNRRRFMGPPENPYNKGDPENKVLSLYERRFIIPQRVRDVANAEKCIEEAEALSSCKESNVLGIFACVKFNRAFKKCMFSWYKDKQLLAKCTEEYLEERSQMRRLGSIADE